MIFLSNLKAKISVVAAICVTAAAALDLSNIAVTNITRISAEYHGELVATNGSGANPDITIYWGTFDSGTNAALWQNSCIISNVPLGAFSTNITGLTPAKYHYATAAATEGTSTVFAAPSLGFWTVAGAPTNAYPDATNGVYLLVATNGLFSAPTREAIIVANDLATGADISNLQSQVDTTAAGWSAYPATQDVDLATHGLTLGGITRYDWPAHGTGDVATWSGFLPTQTVDFTEYGLILGGITRTNWPTAAEIGALTNEPEFLASPAAGITADNIAAWSAAYGWGNHALAGYLSITNGTNYFSSRDHYHDDRYAALNHLHSGVYSPVAHTHSWSNQFTPTNSTIFIRSPTNDSDSTNKILYSYSPSQRAWIDPFSLINVTNWMNVPTNITATYIFPKINVGPTNLFPEAPQLLNIKGLTSARTHQSIVAGIAAAQQSRLGGYIKELISSNEYWRNGTYSNAVWSVSWLTNAIDENPDTAVMCDICGYSSVGNTTRTLRISHFGFNIPLNVTVVGITIQAVIGNWKDYGPYPWYGNAYVQIFNNGYTSSIYSAAVPGDMSLGGSNALWGLNSLTPWEVNQNDFAVDIYFNGPTLDSNPKGPALASLDVTIHYTSDELAWTHGVNSAGKWTLRNERSETDVLIAGTNMVEITSPLGVPAIALGTNLPVSNWPAGGTGDASTWSAYPATQNVDLATFGLTLGGITRTNWPSCSNVESNLTAHLAATNPHAITPVLIGALDVASNLADLADAAAARSNLAAAALSDFANHLANTSPDVQHLTTTEKSIATNAIQGATITTGDVAQVTTNAGILAFVVPASGGSGGTGSISLAGGWLAVDAISGWGGYQTGVGSTTNNAIVVCGWSTPDSTNNSNSGWAFFSADTNNLQDKCAFARIAIPPYAASWGETAIVFRVRTSSTNIADCHVDLQLDDGNTTFSTGITNLVSSEAGQWSDIPVLAADLPEAWTNDLSNIRPALSLRGDYFAMNSNYVQWVEAICFFK